MILLEYIKKLESEEFNEKFMELEKGYEADMDRIEDNAFVKVKDGHVCKNWKDVMFYVVDAQKELEKRSNEFSEDVERFLIKWNQQSQ